MKWVFFLSLFVATSVHAVTDSWVKENCPNCFRTEDGAFLYIVNGQIIKFKVRPYGRQEKLSSERLEIIWEGISDRSGKISSREVTFKNAGEKEQFAAKFQRLCRLFKSYNYYSSKTEFTQGDHFSPADQPTSGVIHQTCFKQHNEKDKSLTQSMKGLVNFLSGDEASRSDINVNDAPRGERREAPSENWKERTGSSAQRK